MGDSLELARKARDFSGDVIAFCGVWFMAETAKVLNPERIVVVPDRDAGCSLVDSCPVEQLRAWKRRQSRIHDRLLHQYVGRSEGRKRYSVHLAQRGEDRQFDSRRAAGAVPARYQSGQLRSRADRPREHEDLAGRLHRPRDVCGAQAARPRAPSILPRWWPRIRNAPTTCCHGGFYRLDFGHRRLVRVSGRAGIHRHDRKRRALFARKTGARTRSFISCRTRSAIAASART